MLKTNTGVIDGNGVDRVLRKPDVVALVGVTERAIRDWEVAGKFPKRFKLDPDGRSVGWLESEVQEWLRQRAASRETEAA